MESEIKTDLTADEQIMDEIIKRNCSFSPLKSGDAFGVRKAMEEYAGLILSKRNKEVTKEDLMPYDSVINKARQFYAEHKMKPHWEFQLELSKLSKAEILMYCDVIKDDCVHLWRAELDDLKWECGKVVTESLKKDAIINAANNVIEKLKNDQPYSLIEVLKATLECSDILLHEKGYDRGGWERLEYAYRAGNEIKEPLHKAIVELSELLKINEG